MFGEARCFGKTSAAELIFELWRKIGIPAPGIEVVGPHSALEVTFAARRALRVADEAWDSHGVRKALSGPKLLSDEVNRPPRVLNFVPAISYAICVLGPRILRVTCVEGIASRARPITRAPPFSKVRRPRCWKLLLGAGSGPQGSRFAEAIRVSLC